MGRPQAFGPLCRPPPGELARGRRSLASGAVGPGGGCAERGTICVNGVSPPAGLRPAVPTRRSAVPCLRAAMPD